ncbi:hypothetical protein CVT26_010858 [Gymnopilus dilepis]|uniref:Uncharacterized protein n=1 Tax=Gymnopilus dilepis TaxID=231916 RepID=A0A409W5B1_9AGAR|nr:hypothetical protein CVT26_010858 [Gymnopilus dilepis]
MSAVNQFGFDNKKEAFVQLKGLLGISDSPEAINYLRKKLELIGIEHLDKELVTRDIPNARRKIEQCLEHQLPIYFGNLEEQEKEKRLYFAVRAVSRYHCYKTRLFRNHLRLTGEKKAVKRPKPRRAKKNIQFRSESGSKRTINLLKSGPEVALEGGVSTKNNCRDVTIVHGRNDSVDITMNEGTEVDAQSNPAVGGGGASPHTSITTASHFCLDRYGTEGGYGTEGASSTSHSNALSPYFIPTCNLSQDNPASREGDATTRASRHPKTIAMATKRAAAKPNSPKSSNPARIQSGMEQELDEEIQVIEPEGPNNVPVTVPGQGSFEINAAQDEKIYHHPSDGRADTDFPRFVQDSHPQDASTAVVSSLVKLPSIFSSPHPTLQREVLAPILNNASTPFFDWQVASGIQMAIHRFLEACGLGSMALSLSFIKFGCRTDADLHRFATLSCGMRKEKLREILSQAGQFTELNLALLEDKLEKYL